MGRLSKQEQPVSTTEFQTDETQTRGRCGDHSAFSIEVGERCHSAAADKKLAANRSNKDSCHGYCLRSQGFLVRTHLF